MTKYILTGGRDRARENKDYAALLANELHKQYDTFNILSCFFAKPEEHWPLISNHWEEWFQKKVGSVGAYDYARIDKFVDQIKDFDIIYLHGGDNKSMRDVLETFEPLADLFKGKTVIGSSAGVNALAKNFWGSTHRKPFKGLAVLDINTMVHYGSPRHDIGKDLTQHDWDEDEKKFQEFIGVAQKILCIPEGEILTFEVED